MELDGCITALCVFVCQFKINNIIRPHNTSIDVVFNLARQNWEEVQVAC